MVCTYVGGKGGEREGRGEEGGGEGEEWRRTKCHEMSRNVTKCHEMSTKMI